MPPVLSRSRIAATLIALASLASPSLWADGPQPAPAGAGQPQAEEELEIILTVKANGVVRGDFNLLQRADGDYWVAAQELPRLKVAAQAGALRQHNGEPYYSLRALGAASLEMNEEDLSLTVQFPAAAIPGTRIDLLNPPPPVRVLLPERSLILGYRLAVTPGLQGRPDRAVADSDANLRLGPLLLRQEVRFNSRPSAAESKVTRGVTQAVWDDTALGLRATAGDLVSSAGPFGSVITGAGLVVRKAYEITPDTIRQPMASLRAETALPADVEVAVDGRTIHRAHVGPGPIALDNLLMYGGTRNVRLTITDITGHQDVIEQPFLFTDAVLARGLHEYSYFLGRRSDIGPGGRPLYREAAWQGYHRYGVSDWLTLGAGGEGNRDFRNVGIGATLRSDRLGLFGLDLLNSESPRKGLRAQGWSARYTYSHPDFTASVGNRRFDPGFRSFNTTDETPFVLDESRLSIATRLRSVNLAFELTRRRDALERRDAATMRLVTHVAEGATLSAELERSKVNRTGEWSAYLFLRKQLGSKAWVASTARSRGALSAVDIETGRQLGQEEGFGYRLGLTASQARGNHNALALGTALWNLKPVTLEAYASSQMRGGNAQYLELAASGALVGVDGEWGLARRVTDSFVVARLGTPVEGVDISLNNQVQGRTDATGRLFLPGVGAYGRQDLSLDEKQLGLNYDLAYRRRTISLPYRSGLVVDFGARRIHAIAGMAWMVRDGTRAPIATQAWKLRSDARELSIETSRAGDFYVEDAPPGRYSGAVLIGDRAYACRLDVPEFTDVVHELEEGVICE